MKRNANLPDLAGKTEAEELDALNARMRRRADAGQLIEASIDAKAKRARRRQKQLGST